MISDLRPLHDNSKPSAVTDSRITALQRAKDIAGKTREIQGKLYIDDAPERHEKLDALMLELLEPEHPELVEFVRKLRLWYG